MISRRRFTKLLGAAAAIGAFRPRLFFTAESPASSATPAAVSTAAAEIYRKAFVLDGNALAGIGFPVDDHDLVAVTKLIVGSGVNVVKATLGGFGGKFEETVADIANAQMLVDEQPDAFLKVTKPEHLDRAKKEGKLGLIFSFESASMWPDDAVQLLERMKTFWHMGLRTMQLTYNRRTPLGCGCLDGETDGLTELGRRAIQGMTELGVALDLSHSNTQTTADGIAASKKPPLITHAGCRAVFMHPRNKEDRELKALADKGGVVGIYMLPYLTESPRQPMREDFLKHLDHAFKVCGEDHVGIGTDVPFLAVDDAVLEQMKKGAQQRKAAGIAAPGEDRPTYIPDLNTERKLELVTDGLLQRGYKSTAIEKILGANFKRAYSEIWS